MTSCAPQERYGIDADANTQLNPSQLPRRLSRSSASQPTRHPSRVEKPRSTHASPRTLERRKTTSGTKRLATLDDHFNMMFGVEHGETQAIEEPRGSARPFSWHPSSNQFHAPPRSSICEPSPIQAPSNWTPYDSSRHSSFESEYPSISARSSVHPDQNLNLPSYLSNNMSRNGGSYFSDASWQDVPSRSRPTSYARSCYSTPAMEQPSWHVQNWVRDAQAQRGASRVGSTEFLPIQHPVDENGATASLDNEEDTGKELVGMGLYDPPSGGLLFGSGNGLKLAETWKPPKEEEDDDVMEDADASSDDGSVEEPPAKGTEQWPSLATKEQIPASMEGQSFFFEEDENYTKEWWFQQLKQPTVRDAGLGYGWL